MTHALRSEVRAHHRNLALVIGAFASVLIIIQVRFSINSRQMRQIMYDLRNEQLKHSIEQANHQYISKADRIKIDFAIGGFPKCGTTSLMLALNTNETFMGYEKEQDLKEIHHIRKGKMDEFNSMFEYSKGKTTQKGKRIKNGFKSPEILMSEDFIKNMERYYPDTDLILSLRHPVLHFQSLYNYKLRPEKYLGVRPDPLSLIGDCGHQCFNNCIPNKYRGACTSKSNFHYGLSRIMLTPMNTTQELDLIDHNDWSRHPGYRGRVFLLELGQIGDVSTIRKKQFTNDLESFMGLDLNTVEFPRHNVNNNTFIDICDHKNKPVRDVLMRTASNASMWIERYFLKSPRVTVANPTHFVELIRTWRRDPCDKQ